MHLLMVTLGGADVMTHVAWIQKSRTFTKRMCLAADIAGFGISSLTRKLPNSIVSKCR
jgi:hypothetical protein